MLCSGQDLLNSLEKAKSKPHVLDDATLQHVQRVYTDQQHEIKLYQSLSSQWLKEKIKTPQQKDRLKEFTSKIEAVVCLNKRIFFLVDFFKAHTIEKILKKNDFELAMELLTGKVFPA